MITKEMTIRQVLEKDINSAEIFLESGMHCVGCLPHPAKPSSRHAMVHGLDADILVAKLNEFFGE